MADRKHGHAPPPTESTLRGLDWYGEDLTGQTHTRVAFVEVDLTEAIGQNATFTECTFRGVKFNASVHTDAAFINCTFTQCGFFDVSFTGCKLVGSMFDGCAYDLMTVTGGDWSFVGLPGADLRRTKFEGVRMREADLTGARLDGGSFRRVDLSGAWLAKSSMIGSDLRGSDLTALDPLTVQLAGAIIDVDQACVVAARLGLDVRAD
ncbi:pentapeptide repeat-containing protein [Hamadaea sp. NPDC051192]|uniref:pentapeptide repeat-containing protein n=1 Tax=Hamadaea sp. NPDC051192 TaxID=3154940 RepID=UPI0034366AE7